MTVHSVTLLYHRIKDLSRVIWTLIVGLGGWRLSRQAAG